MFKMGKHHNVYSRFLNLFSNKKILFALLAIAIISILIPTISFATEVMDAEGETLPEKVENAINDIIGETPAPAPAAPAEDMDNYLCFTPAEPGASVTFQFGPYLDPWEGMHIDTVYYSDDVGHTWNKLKISEDITINGPIYIKSSNPNGFNKDHNNSFRFNIDKNNKINASGSVMSLIDNGAGTMTSISHIDYCFNSLFEGCKGLMTPPDLPAITLGSDCYEYMFLGCTNLKSAPKLPALEIAKYAYSNMLRGCESLQTPPELPATQLAEGCYRDMFLGCTILDTAPELPATTLAEKCYEYMFYNCKALVKAPYLPANILPSECYERMFCGCSLLKEVSVGFTSWNDAESATTNWLSGVSSSGFFKCQNTLPEILDVSHIPANWTVQYIVTVKVEGYNDVYDGQEHGLIITPIEPKEITIQYSRDGSSWSPDPIIEKNVGEYKVYYKLTADGYVPFESSAMIIITPKTDASASFVGAPYSKMYGDADPDFKVNFNGLVGGFTPKLYEDYTIMRETGEDVTASGDPHKVIFNWINPNYDIPSLETTLAIAKTNKFKLVCDNVSKVSYEPDPDKFTAHMEGLKFDDELLSTDYDIDTISSNVNPNVITLKPKFSTDVSDRLKNNYDINDTTCFVNGTYKIYEDPTKSEFQFMVETYDSYYDGQDHEFKINVKNPASGAAVQYKKEGDADWHDDPYSFKDVGEYKITYKITHDGFAELEDSATLIIQKAPATVVPNACSKNEGEADPALTAKVYGLVDGESLEPGVDYDLQRQPGETPGMYEIYCVPTDSETANNYELTGADSKFFIASAGGTGAQGTGSSVAQTGDMNLTIFAVIGLAALIAGGYIAYRKTRKN